MRLVDHTAFYAERLTDIIPVFNTLDGYDTYFLVWLLTY